MFLQVDRAQGTCGLASLDYVKDTWAKMAEQDILTIWVTAPLPPPLSLLFFKVFFFYIDAAAKMSPQCAM